MRRRRFLWAAVTLPGGHLEGREQRGGAVTLVIVALTTQRPAVRHFQITLSPLQRLDRGLFVDTEDNRVLRRGHVETDHVGGLGGELWIAALAPGFAPSQVDLLGTQKPPDILHIDVAERCGQQRSRPAGIALGLRLVQQRQNAFARFRRVFRLSTSVARFVQTAKPLFGIAHAPLRCRAGRAANSPSDRPARQALRGKQHDPGALPQSMLRLRRTHQALKLSPLRRRQNNSRRLRDAAHTPLNHDSFFTDSGY